VSHGGPNIRGEHSQIIPAPTAIWDRNVNPQ
jgi:hypothetical protein